MRKLLFIAALAMTVMQACEKSDNTPGQEPVSEKAKQALVAKYPGASNVVWQNKNGYVVASFSATAVRATSAQMLDAWFDNGGAWYMTETDITFDQLPEAVKTAHKAGTYAEWLVDDVDKIERSGTETVYVIEVKLNGKEMDLYYSPDGVLVKEMADVDNDYDYGDYIPTPPSSSIESYLQTNYPAARILDIDHEGRFTEVEILDGRVKRELVFDGSTWLRTKTELRIAEVPAATMDVLKASAYAAYRIDDVDHYLTAASKYYRFELKSASGDVDVEITEAGVLTVVETDSPDDDYTGSTNQTVADFIAKQYPGARIIESEYEKGYLEVEIRHDNREKTVRFNASNAWIDTQWDIRVSELPQAVMSAIAASAYASYQIDDAEYVQAPSGDYYEVEVEKGDREATLRIKADGTML